MLKKGMILITRNQRKVVVTKVDIKKKKFFGSYSSRKNKNVSIIDSWSFAGINLTGIHERDIPLLY